jgi:molybdopterin converting factor small subunit
MIELNGHADAQIAQLLELGATLEEVRAKFAKEHPQLDDLQREIIISNAVDILNEINGVLRPR